MPRLIGVWEYRFVRPEDGRADDEVVVGPVADDMAERLVNLLAHYRELGLTQGAIENAESGLRTAERTMLVKRKVQ